MESSLDLLELIDMIDEPNRSCCLTLFNDHKDRIITAPGSLTKHQAWEGGYISHLEHCMNWGVDMYDLLPAANQKSFSTSDINLVIFLHDLEKPFRYVEPKMEFASDKDKADFLEKMISQYGFTLTEDHRNALKYIHGEGSDYSRTERVQGPLAAFCHCCDVVSSRILFDLVSFFSSE